MQSKLAASASKFNRIFSLFPEQQLLRGWEQRFRYAASTTGRTADPSIYREEPEEEGSSEEVIRDSNIHRRSETEKPTSKENDTYVPPKSPIESSPKLKAPGVSHPIDPYPQQKRRNSTSNNNISCSAGIDLSPWPEEDRETDIGKQRKEQEEDYKEYFKHHKASPLSEIEITDTRKPVSRATDSTFGKDGGGVIVWRPEQMDSAEDSLRRATEIFRLNATRGDPNSPHGRVLRQLRGEDW